MKKRIVSLVLLFAMLMSLLPGRVSAAEITQPPADEVNAGGVSNVHIYISPPSVGDSPHYYPYKDRDDDYDHYSFITNINSDYFQNGVLWRDLTAEKDMLAQYETFIYGHVYRVRMYLTPASGFVFANNVMGFVNGTTAQVELMEDGDLELSFTFPAVTTTLIRHVDVYAAGPSVGDAPRYDAIFPEEVHCSFRQDLPGTFAQNGVSWRDMTAERDVLLDDSGTVFIKDHVYRLRVELAPDEGYTFSPLMTAGINGSTAEVRMIDYEDGPARVRLTYYFPAVTKTLIYDVNVTIPAPAANKMPSYSPVISADAHCSPRQLTIPSVKNGVSWRDMTDGYDMEPETVAFQVGHSYRLRIELAPDEGYAFANVLLNYTINGKEPAEIRAVEDDYVRLTYYFPAISGWVKEEGSWYYYNSDGTLALGWKKINDVWYYFNPTSGAMQTGWLKVGGKWYYLASSGAMQTGWQQVNGKWYYLESNGVMVTGWKQLNGKWYYFASSGAMQTGWQKINNVWYFFKTSGIMAAKEWCNGYWLNASGSWTYPYKASWKTNAKGKWFGDTSGWYAKNCSIVIDDVSCTFDANGYLIQ